MLSPTAEPPLETAQPWLSCLGCSLYSEEFVKIKGTGFVVFSVFVFSIKGVKHAKWVEANQHQLLEATGVLLQSCMVLLQPLGPAGGGSQGSGGQADTAQLDSPEIQRQF